MLLHFMNEHSTLNKANEPDQSVSSPIYHPISKNLMQLSGNLEPTDTQEHVWDERERESLVC